MANQLNQSKSMAVVFECDAEVVQILDKQVEQSKGKYSSRSQLLRMIINKHIEDEGLSIDSNQKPGSGFSLDALRKQLTDADDGELMGN